MCIFLFDTLKENIILCQDPPTTLRFVDLPVAFTGCRSSYFHGYGLFQQNYIIQNQQREEVHGANSEGNHFQVSKMFLPSGVVQDVHNFYSKYVKTCAKRVLLGKLPCS